ncbi:hypothetical protein [Actinomadura atramentaria]|uniref:hypothetical protein n=1 Tax=Actinomadura atramentaria TaxID=1990 RepID=UPI000368A249|nr:hypothetical protein [Actinomadura atramentaria]
MFKRAIVTGLIVGAGFSGVAATPALAGVGGDDPQNQQLLNLQTCRDVLPIISDILAIKNQQGNCGNGVAGNSKHVHVTDVHGWDH